ncbi:hypothetical protein D3C71_2100440 [compost metagenome]
MAWLRRWYRGRDYRAFVLSLAEVVRRRQRCFIRRPETASGAKPSWNREGINFGRAHYARQELDMSFRGAWSTRFASPKCISCDSK